MLRMATGWAVLAASVLCIVSVSCQDNGQKAAELKPLINGTLPSGQRFRAASTSVDTAAFLGVLSTGPLSQAQSNATAQTGILKLGLSTSSRDGYIFVPNSYNSSRTNSMILAIHAAGKGGLDALGVLIDQANSSGIILLAPDSRGATWDALPAQDGAFGPDIAFISAALAQAFAQYNVNADTLGIQGFSDGATYALGLGMTNGKLFAKVMANSPGGVIAERVQGMPPIFMSAGLQDDIFPINQAGNPTACYLKSVGYNVTYIQFTGKHEVPPQIANDTIQWYQGNFREAGSFPSGICSA
ncbi:probable feruloyl esterase C [Coccomyxa sp. Obi]|nr:probable feruloyl esterase C [Coccomyxa sp. Obi]